MSVRCVFRCLGAHILINSISPSLSPCISLYRSAARRPPNIPTIQGRYTRKPLLLAACLCLVRCRRQKCLQLRIADLVPSPSWQKCRALTGLLTARVRLRVCAHPCVRASVRPCVRECSCVRGHCVPVRLCVCACVPMCLCIDVPCVREPCVIIGGAIVSVAPARYANGSGHAQPRLAQATGVVLRVHKLFRARESACMYEGTARWPQDHCVLLVCSMSLRFRVWVHTLSTLALTYRTITP